MLTSITPLGERGRGQRWGVTATALTIGHLAGGAVLGGALAVGSVARRARWEPSTMSMALLIAAIGIVAAAGDLRGVRLPGRRQVDERWMTTFRGWVYGLGFGVQLGMGVVTVVNTWLLVAMIGAGLLLDPLSACGIGVGYGAVRALMTLPVGRVRSVEQLKRVHRGLDRFERAAGYGTMAVVTAVGAMVVVT